MHFLKLTIRTTEETFEYFYQMKWIEDIFSQSKEFICEETETYITINNYLEEN